MKYLAVLVALFVINGSSLAQTELNKSPLNKPTFISPYYFGPNAFPVPDMLDGRVRMNYV